MQIIYLPTQTSHLHLLHEEHTTEPKVQNKNANSSLEAISSNWQMSKSLYTDIISDEIQLTTNKSKFQRNSWTKVGKTSGYSSMLSVERVGSQLGSSVQNLFKSLSSSRELGYTKIDHVNMSPRARSDCFEQASYESNMHNKVDCLHDDSGLGLVSITFS